MTQAIQKIALALCPLCVCMLMRCGASKPPQPPIIATTDPTPTPTSAPTSTPTSTPTPAPTTPTTPSFNPRVVWQEYSGIVLDEDVTADTTTAKYFVCRFADSGTAFNIGEFLNSGTTPTCNAVWNGAAKTSSTFVLLAMRKTIFDTIFTWTTQVGNAPDSASFVGGVKADGTKLYVCRAMVGTTTTIWRIGSFDASQTSAGCQTIDGSTVGTNASFQFLEVKNGVKLEEGNMSLLGANQLIGPTKDGTTDKCTMETGLPPVETKTVTAKYSFKLAAKSTVFLDIAGLCGHAKTIDFTITNDTTSAAVTKAEMTVDTSDQVFELALDAGSYSIDVMTEDGSADTFVIRVLSYYTKP